MKKTHCLHLFSRIILNSILSVGWFLNVGLASADDSTTLEIPALIALTDYASTFGSEELNGYTLALEEWNAHGGVAGRKVRLKVEDTKTSSVGTVTALRRQMSSGAKVMLGPTWADTFQGVLPIAAKSKLLLLTPSAEGRAIDQKVNEGPALVTVYPSTEVEISGLAKTAFKHGAKRLGVVTEEEPFGIFLKTLLEESVVDSGAEIVVNQSIPGGVTDFRAILSSMKRMRVDSLFVFVFTESSVISLLRQANELAVGAQLYGIHDVSSYVGRAEFATYLEGMIYVVFEVKDEAFVERYKTRFGYAPRLTASYAYDAANMLLRAFSLGFDTPDKLRRYLLDNRHETVSYGSVGFLPEGRLTEAQIRMMKVEGSKSAPLPQ